MENNCNKDCDLPLCINCETHMFWDKEIERFVCPLCNETFKPTCDNHIPVKPETKNKKM